MRIGEHLLCDRPLSPNLHKAVQQAAELFIGDGLPETASSQVSLPETPYGIILPRLHHDRSHDHEHAAQGAPGPVQLLNHDDITGA